MISNKFLTVVAVVLLFGCSSKPLDPRQDPTMESIEEHRAASEEAIAAVSTRQALMDATRTRVPDDAPWLLDKAPQSQFRSLDAQQAFRKVSPKLVVFDVEPGEINTAAPPLTNGMTYKDYFDAIAAQADWHWSVVPGAIHVTDAVTRQISVNQLAGQTTGKVTSASLTVDTAKSQPLEQAITADVYGDLSTALGNMREPGTDIQLIETAGVVSVTGRPSYVRKIEQFINDYNYRMGREAHITFALYEVTISDGSTRQLDLSILRDAAISSSITSRPPSAPNSTELSLMFDEGNSFDGSEMVLRWLNTQGSTNIVLERTLPVMHMKIATIDNTRPDVYISRVATEREISGATETQAPTVETEEFLTGDRWLVLPNIGEDRVFLAFALNRAELTGFEEFDFGDGQVTGSLPNFNEAIYYNFLSIGHGETKIITDLSSDRSTVAQQSSPFLAWMGRLGKSNDRNSSNVQTVLTMTAHIVP